MVIPSKFFAGDDGVVVGERFILDGCFDLGQQPASTTVLVGFCSLAVMATRPTPRLAGPGTFRDHRVVWVTIFKFKTLLINTTKSQTTREI